jgi:hypothetical protein
MTTPPPHAFVCRLAPRTTKRDKLRGTLIPVDVSAEGGALSEDYEEYFQQTISEGKLPQIVQLEFGQPPTKSGKLEIEKGNLIIFLVGSDNPDGSDNTRGVLGLGVVESCTMQRSGVSARATLQARPIVRLRDCIQNKDILRSPYFPHSGIEEIRIFGLTTAPQAHNCVRFSIPGEEPERTAKRFSALLKIFRDFDTSTEPQLKRNNPELLTFLEAKFSSLTEDDEQKIDGVIIDVAEESPGNDELFSKPYDPNLIRVDAKMFSLQNIRDMLADGDLDLAPDFQRKLVWTEIQKCRLIESILLRIPLPAFYFSTSHDGRYSVVDGLQRLSTVTQFMRDEFHLEKTSLEYLSEQIGGKTFSDLETTLWGRRIKTTQILVNVIDPQTPEKVKFDIFKRINTGGSPLEAQEIRHCISGKESRALLKECAESNEFYTATAGSLSRHPRMGDREFVLRFFAFKLRRDWDEYTSAGSMDAFLTEATKKIDYELSQKEIDRLRDQFLNAMKNATALFGEHAFRKWPVGTNRRSPINRALFETWAVALSESDLTQLQPRKDRLVLEAREMMTSDYTFLDSISTATGAPQKVKIRFSRVCQLVKPAHNFQ